jgi:NAD(P)-dependent dehydrogenase (short-subunit alcohol dehydrogenase family)
MRLENKVILITGSVTGIGKAIAKRCVAEGAKVVIHGLEQELGETLLAELGVENAVLIIHDLADEGAPLRLVEAAIGAFGRLDAVVNNAAQVGTGNIQLCCALLDHSSGVASPGEDRWQRHQHRQCECLQWRAQFDALFGVQRSVDDVDPESG